MKQLTVKPRKTRVIRNPTKDIRAAQPLKEKKRNPVYKTYQFAGMYKTYSV